MISAKCNKCGSLLFDCDGFKAFNKPNPVDITCAGCQTVYRVKNTKGNKVVLTVRGGFKPLPVEHYG